MNLLDLEKAFKRNRLHNEDDVKLHFHTDIVYPLLKQFNPLMAYEYRSEGILPTSGRPDATFQHVSFEFKADGRFLRESGIHEALYGRNDRDHGLYDYILGNSGIEPTDNEDTLIRKITKSIGIGFDGRSFIFARFVPSHEKRILNTEKVSFKIAQPLNLKFIYEKKDFLSGLKRLALLLKQKDKIELTKQNVLAVFSAKSDFVRRCILDTYEEIKFNLNDLNGSDRVRTLFSEWDRVFGIMYGDDEEATGFTEVSSRIRDVYGISDEIPIDSKMYLFAMQTFFNIFLKLLIYSFLSQLVDPTFNPEQELSKAEIDRLFDGTNNQSNNLVSNFFEAHFLEWFTYTSSEFEVKIVNDTLERINEFDLGTFVIKPEDVQDILQEVYMELIPVEMRHLMGEYFSPDWIVEHALDLAGYHGDIEETLIDPCAGSGPFLTQAIKRIIRSHEGTLTKADICKITNNVVGFDINPISVVAAKANYILIMFSAFFDNCDEDFGSPVAIPVFIADSILSPVVYTEENGNTLKLKTSVGDLELPKFESFSKGNEFLALLSSSIHEKAKYEVFVNQALGRRLIQASDEDVVKSLFDRLYVLHRSGKDSFWPIILRNSFAPTMIGNKFDFVVGNPPWIAWKSMSRSYREGTLAIWQSYGIFEKNAYDKKTTHDDFGMAVTYVAIDQYLKTNGTMVFLLPASFLKSTKGGEGFRKFEIIRNKQDIPFRIECVHDFSNVSLFTVPTVAIKFIKGVEMSYPIHKYCVYSQVGRKSRIDSHSTWSSVEKLLTQEILCAQPVDQHDIQSAWLVLKDMTFANRVLDRTKQRSYRGRKGIEPAGAKGVYVLRHPKKTHNGYLRIENDITRQRRQDIKDKGVHIGVVEETFVYPMLGGRNIAKWLVRSNEFMLVPHTAIHKYGVPEKTLALEAPHTFSWLSFYHDELLATRIQNGKFFNPNNNPFYRLDNVGEYTFSPYKVLWKEQAGSMASVVVGSYYESIPNADHDLFSNDKTIVVDSKVLMLDVYDEMEAYYVCGIINAPNVIQVIDGYGVSTNRGTDVLKYIAVPKYDAYNQTHKNIANISKFIHVLAQNHQDFETKERELAEEVFLMFTNQIS
ncbi:Eco57I restriction-modification methylase domain-containing protein [Mesotoga sp. UBA5557]|uniref:Eco57I restriction-modification methylase domain-containing protein n=1 Tax=Mesotoga sp. UBA5557 TaxID=1946857 RepID=UPI0025F81315|nr:N-6 DNA methylase [Mesotoga sp. UBA5557]